MADDQSELVSSLGVLQIIESNGNGYMLIYNQFDGVSTNLYARHFDGIGWGTPVAIDSDTEISTPTSFNIATNEDIYLVTWKQFVGSFVNIYPNEFDGVDWGTPQPIENSDSTIEGFYDYVRVVSNGDSYLATWYQSIGGVFDQVNVNIYNAGSWGTPVSLDIDTQQFFKDGAPFAATNQNGDYAVAWRSLDIGAVVVNTYDGTTWNVSTELSLLGGAFSASFSTISGVEPLTGSGAEFAVIYTDGGDVATSVFDGSVWSAPEIFETGVPSVSFNNLDIASDGNGFLAGWTQDDGTGIFDVLSNRYDPTAGSWGGEVILDQDADNSAFDLHLTGTTGGYFAGWTQAEPLPAGDPGVRYPWAKVGF